jgi:hypothetical protein
MFGLHRSVSGVAVKSARVDDDVDGDTADTDDWR